MAGQGGAVVAEQINSAYVFEGLTLACQLHFVRRGGVGGIALARKYVDWRLIVITAVAINHFPLTIDVLEGVGIVDLMVDAKGVASQA